MTTVETSGDLTSQLGAIATPSSKEDNVAEIERLLSAEFVDFLRANGKAETAKNDAAIEVELERGARETMMTRIAALSQANAWSSEDVEDAVTKIVKAYPGNDKRKKSSVATFKSEVILSADRRVRAHVATAFQASREAFDAENRAKEANDNAETPLRKAFSRMYHTAVAVLKAYRKDDTRRFSVTCAADVTAFAVQTLRDRRFNPEGTKKKLDAIAKQLREFYTDFRVDAMNECIEYLDMISEADLKAGYERAQNLAGASEPDAEDAPEAEAAETVEEAAPVSRDEALEDALSDIYGNRAAA